MLVEYSVISVKGNCRVNNQDNFFVDSLVRNNAEEDVCFSGNINRTTQAFAVFDGMGGEKDGEIASFIAADTLKNYSDSNRIQNWNDYLKNANQKICDHRKKREVHAGTTFAGVFLRNNQFLAVNIGDSRIYTYKDNEIRQISYDDTEFQLLLNRGEVTELDYYTSKARNHLTQHLGLFTDEVNIRPHSIFGTVQKGMRILLCSDGLCSVLTNSELLNLLTFDEDMEKTCHYLVEKALQKGSRDNITVMLLHVLETDENLKDAADAMSVLPRTDEDFSSDEFEETVELYPDYFKKKEKKHALKSRILLFSLLFCILILIGMIGFQFLPADFFIRMLDEIRAIMAELFSDVQRMGKIT